MDAGSDLNFGSAGVAKEAAGKGEGLVDGTEGGHQAVADGFYQATVVFADEAYAVGEVVAADLVHALVAAFAAEGRGTDNVREDNRQRGSVAAGPLLQIPLLFLQKCQIITWDTLSAALGLNDDP